ncbi:T9SS type B sorting domain-containing protein, partial [Mesonia sp. HuA40]|uniref:T9SS type B sorting domain-containing protein n=1 Tax=Mesonia sp. HuA40 TaxID=2602761 RepID=UPI0011C763B4
TNPGGTSILNNQDVGNVTSFTPANPLPSNTTIYVSIIPYNSAGNASTCAEESFTTESVTTEPPIDKNELVIPNFFTPNSDGINDVLRFKDPKNEMDYVLIFDRYGKLLHQSNTSNRIWDGNYNGKPMPSNDYWIKVFLKSKYILKLNITLKR